ncbi:MAG: DUF177 domain-containing protein [Candidatus Marinimicrobia bacterium]|nr:DUF177 domain-containing protein [Candidatus Neomarinimicrobiota bacterium]
MKIFRTDLHIGLNNKLFEISSGSLGLDKVSFSEDKITCTIHSEQAPNGYYLKGLMTVSIRESCDRCLIDFNSKQKIEFSILLTSDVKLIKNDEHDVIFFTDQDDAIEIDPVLAEYILLDRPLKKLCTEDCKGLCTSCGCNKNEIDCDCKQETQSSSREVLKNIN